MDSTFKESELLLLGQIRTVDDPGVCVCELLDLRKCAITKLADDLVDAATTSRMSNDVNIVVAGLIDIFFPNVASVVFHALRAWTGDSCLRVAVMVRVHHQHLVIILLRLLQERKHGAQLQ